MKNNLFLSILFTLLAGLLIGAGGGSCPPPESDTVSLTLTATGQFDQDTPIETVEFLLYHPGATYSSTTFMDAAIQQSNPNTARITKRVNSSVVTGPNTTLANTTKYTLVNINDQQYQDNPGYHISLGQLITTKFTAPASTLPSIREFKAYDSNERPISGLSMDVQFVQTGT